MPRKRSLVLEIVLRHEADVRIEIDAGVGERLERLGVREPAVFDDGALGACRPQHRFGAVRVHHAAQSLRTRFAARRIDLLLRQRRHAAVADARRREDLDQVGAFGLQLADLLADLIGRPLRIRDLAERRQDARAGQHAAVDRIAQHLVRHRADALHGREAGHQRDVGVLGPIERGLLGGLRPAVIAALVVEMPADVDVRVDEAGQQREVARDRSSAPCSMRPTLTILPSLIETVALLVTPPRPSITCRARIVMPGSDCRAPMTGAPSHTRRPNTESLFTCRDP